jgi:ketosteroid isomerase-like protein
MTAELQTLSDTWYAAWFAKDDGTVDRLMAADYVYVAPNGLVLDRATILGIIRSPSYRLDRGGRSEVVYRPLGADVAIVRGRWQGEGSYEGTAFRDDHRCVTVWARQDGAWRIVFEQCSAVAG